MKKKINEISQKFNEVLLLCDQLFGKDAFRKPSRSSEEKRKNPVSLVVFEMLAVSIAKLTTEETKQIIKNKKTFVNLYTELFKDDILQRYLTGGTSKIPAVTYRFKQMKSVIQETLK